MIGMDEEVVGLDYNINRKWQKPKNTCTDRLEESVEKSDDKNWIQIRWRCFCSGDGNILTEFLLKKSEIYFRMLHKINEKKPVLEVGSL